MWRTSSMARPAETSSPATCSASRTVRTLWSMRMFASHNGYHNESAICLTLSRGMLSCNSIKSRSEYGSSSPRPRPPVATIANPLVAVMPISMAFVVSQKSCKSSSASRSAAESSRRTTREQLLGRRGQIRRGAQTSPPPGPPFGELRRRDLVSAQSFRLLPRHLPITLTVHGRELTSQFTRRLTGRRFPAHRCEPGPRCRQG